MRTYRKHACVEPGCAALTGKLRCRKHAAAHREEQRRPCAKPGCDGTDYRASGLCRRHYRNRRTADAARLRRNTAKAPVLPDEPVVTLVSMPVRPWVHRPDAGWLGVATWPDQVRRSVAAVDVSRVLDRSSADNSALFAGGAA